MTSKSLETFEKRFNDWMPDYSIGYYRGAEEAEFLSEQFDRLIETKLETTDRIIASQKDIVEGIDKVNLGIENISQGLEEVKGILDWGFTEIIWRIEQTNEILQEILQVLQAPLDTQSKELRKRGVDAYNNGWFDDAFKDFLESEKKNRYDFTIHHYLGNIYFLHRNNPKKALEYYKNAVKYAIPKSPLHASFSLLHIGLIYYLSEEFQEAYESTLKAIELSSDFYEAHYEHARYCAKLNRNEDAVHHLKIAIVEGNDYYMIKSSSEKDFDGLKDQLADLYDELRNEMYIYAKEEMDKVKNLVKKAETVEILNHYPKIIKDSLNNLKSYLERKSYFGNLKAYCKAIEDERDIKNSMIEEINRDISETEKKIEIFERKKKPFKDPNGVFFAIIFMIIGIIVGYFVFTSTNDWNLTVTIFFITYFGSLLAMIIVEIISKFRYSPKIKHEEEKINFHREFIDSLEMESS